MKTPLLIIAALMAAPALNAQQRTVSAEWMANVGDTVYLAEDTLNGSTIDLGSAAGDQSWDFTGLVAHEDDHIPLEIPSTAPLSANFPTADFVVNDLEDSNHIFFDTDSAYLDIVGFVEYDSNGQPMLPEFNFSSRWMAFPSTFGDSYSQSQFVFKQQDSLFIDPDGGGPHPMIDSIRSKIFFITESEIDAWGEVQLPSGDFLAIRQNTMTSIKISSDFYGNGMWQPFTSLMLQFFGDSVQFEEGDQSMRWWSDNPAANFFIAQVDLDTNGMPEEYITWMNRAPSPYVGVEVDPMNGVTIFPNPTSDVLTILSGQRLGEALMVDISGRTVLRTAITANAEISVAELPSGTYLLQVLNTQGRVVRMEKIVVNH